MTQGRRLTLTPAGVQLAALAGQIDALRDGTFSDGPEPFVIDADPLLAESLVIDEAEAERVRRPLPFELTAVSAHVAQVNIERFVERNARGRHGRERALNAERRGRALIHQADQPPG